MADPEMAALLAEAYSLIGNTTPLSIDCGQLCGQRCCRVEDSGMLLLPGEADFLGAEPGFNYVEDAGDTILLCAASCRREKRPFACRIFPLFPVVNDLTGRDQLQLIHDPRGLSLCPLIQTNYPLRGIFRYLVQRATRVLLQHPLYRQWFLTQSELVTALEEIRLHLTP